MPAKHILLLSILLSGLAGCTPKTFTDEAGYPPIFPDYVGVTVPEGIAPLILGLLLPRLLRIIRK